MTSPLNILLKDNSFIKGFFEAWKDSMPGETGGHEEGGFVLIDSNENISTERWPKGKANIISVPAHPECRYNKKEILATFHTHPNIGSDFLQEPSETDIRAVHNDPDLKGQNYIGEFVISQKTIYLIRTTGTVEFFTDTNSFFANA
jgi:hypothetical protein